MAPSPDRVPGSSPPKTCQFGLVIDNQDIGTRDVFEVSDPISRSLVHLAPAAVEEQALRAVESAEAAFETWRDSTPLERRNVLAKAADILASRKDEIIQAMVAETGAKPGWAAFNIDTAIQFVTEGAGMATHVKGEVLQSNEKGEMGDRARKARWPIADGSSQGSLALVFREPCGVVLGIAPWNAPIVSVRLDLSD